MVSMFSDEEAMRIRYLHYKIKHIEDALEKEDEFFNLDDLNLILEYTKILNKNYQTKNHKEILQNLDITSHYSDPQVNSDIEIQDIMFECARVLQVMAKAYSHLSEKYEEEAQWENAIISMTECSKTYKTAAYFSAAVTYQKELGISLTSESLELNSEEARVFAQSVAALREETNNNLYFASKLYAGLSLLSKRLFYLKQHDEKKKQQIRAQFHYDMGKSCYLKGLASLESSITNINKEKVKKLGQKALWYYGKAKEIWDDMLKNLTLTSAEKEIIELNLSVVSDNLKQNEAEQLSYDEIKKIQDPEPIIIIPENLAPFVPKNIIYLTKFIPKDLNIKRFKAYQKKKLEEKIPYSKKEKLIDQKAGVVRTINELKLLKENNEIEVEKFAEIMEKYSIKLEMIESAIEKLVKK
ncbi:hypothetical protein LCGC14_0290890 [marine sediment metagenome]|uniref:BRO1 domain-containing protein n=1 Tax=marine sediment metagenome TaxID=412755 RepID=A0A0F9TTE0_9ZZZZ